MKKAITILASMFILSCSSDHLGKYQKEPLPDDLQYSIVENNNDQNRNKVTISISKPLTDGQLTTLSQEIYNQFPEAPRFYMYYNLQDDKNNRTWATSHYEPELTIDHQGFTIQEDSLAKEAIKKIDGKVIGKWYGVFHYTVYCEKQNKPILVYIYTDGKVEDKPITWGKHKNGRKINFPNYHEEYYVLNGSNLESYSQDRLLSIERPIK